MQPDYNFTMPPPHITEAAVLLDRYFQERGVQDWAFMNVCSRSCSDKWRMGHSSQDKICRWCGGLKMPNQAHPFDTCGCHKP